MRAFMRGGALGIGLAMLAVGCRDHRASPEVSATEPPWLKNPYDRFRQDKPIPFTPGPREIKQPHPCGAKHRGPCLLLAWEFYNWAWGYVHSAWFMDTDGNEYEFSFDRRIPGPLNENADQVRQAMADNFVAPDEFAKIVAASTALPRRVTEAEAAHAQLLVALAHAGSIESIRDSACIDGGGSTLSAYIFAPNTNSSSPVMLEDVECDFLLKGNASPAARELAQWVHKLRGTPRPYRQRK
jgi:hypothetical protein